MSSEERRISSEGFQFYVSSVNVVNLTEAVCRTRTAAVLVPTSGAY